MMRIGHVSAKTAKSVVRDEANAFGGRDYHLVNGLIVRMCDEPGDDRRVVMSMTCNGLLRWRVDVSYNVPFAVFQAALDTALQEVLL